MTENVVSSSQNIQPAKKLAENPKTIPNKEISFVISFLNDVKKTGALSLPSPLDKKFPELVLQEIKKGNIKIELVTSVMDRMLEDRMAHYDPKTKTIKIYLQHGLDLKKMSLFEKEVLLHELYHVYQDISNQKAERYSEIEGPAYLVEIRYAIYSLGFKSASPAAEKAILQQGLDTKNFFCFFNDQRLKDLVACALTKNDSIWKKGCKEIGGYYIKQKIYIYHINEMLNKVPPIKYGIINYSIQSPISNIVFPLTKDQIDELQYYRSNTTQDIIRSRNDYVKLMDCWIDRICPSFGAQISEYDKQQFLLLSK